MSDRQQNLLQYLIKKRSIKENDLMEQFQLTSRQLSYSIEAINEKLKENQLPIIEKRNGNYYAKNEMTNYLMLHQTIQDIVYSKEDRLYLILILILTRSEELSLDHFCIELQVSKNTALSDVKRAKKILQPHALQIDFSRKAGYTIIGDEWNKRMVLFQAITKIYRNYGSKITEQLLDSSTRYLKNVQKDILKIEKYLGAKYTDEDFYPLIYFISSLFIRIERDQLVDISQICEIEEIEFTKEYQSLIYLSTDFPELPESEKLFITLHLLSSNVRNKRMVSEKDLPLLANSLWEFLIEFESHTMLVLADKKNLLNKLINHFKPAYYRIKYHLPAENILYQKICTEYKVLHNFVRQSIQPLEAFFQTKISDEEIAYITLFVGGHLIDKETNDIEARIIRVVILCPNGLSMSKLLEKKLREIFPEFLFYPTNSIREYENFMLPHDIVFSTVPIQSTRKVYVINEILNKSEQVKLRQYVIKDIYQLDFEGIKTVDILAVIKKYAKINKKEENKILEELDSLLLGDLPANQEDYQTEGLDLVQILSKDVVQVVQTELDWKEALIQTSNQLIQKEIITKDYQKYLLVEYQEKPSYIMLRQRMLLPHLDPDLMAQKLGVSVLVLKQGIDYADQQIHVVILLTTPDKTSHLNILYDLNRLAKNREFVERLKKAETSADAYEIVMKYAEKINE